MIDLTDLQKEVHQLAREKGWYDDRDLSDPDVREAMLELVHTEISEATECVRSGRMTVSYEYQGLDDVFVGLDPEHPVFGLGKPIGFPAELADVVLRWLDFREAFRFGAFKMEPSRPPPIGSPLKLAAALGRMRKELAYTNPYIVEDCFGLARVLGFDLLDVCWQKHEYNKTRPRRHGGKAL